VAYVVIKEHVSWLQENEWDRGFKKYKRKIKEEEKEQEEEENDKKENVNEGKKEEMNRLDASMVVSPSFFLVGLPKTYITCVKSDNLRAKIITCKHQNMKQKVIVKLSNNKFYFPLKSSVLSYHVLFLSQECYHYHFLVTYYVKITQ